LKEIDKNLLGNIYIEKKEEKKKEFKNENEEKKKSKIKNEKKIVINFVFNKKRGK